MTAIAHINEYLTDATSAVGSVAGLIVAVVIACEKIARCIPTNFKNKTLQRVARIAYTFFAVLGLKAPDIVAIENGKIVTNAEAVAQEVINKQPDVAIAESKNMMALYDAWLLIKSHSRIFMYLGAAVIIFIAGWSSRGIVVEAGKVKELNSVIARQSATMDRLQDEVKLQSDMAKQIAIEKSLLQDKADQLKTQIETSYDKTPANTNSCIAPVRVQYLNSSRKAANSIGGR